MRITGRRRSVGLVVGIAVAALIGGSASAGDGGDRGHGHGDGHGHDDCTAGAPGIGDEYFPTYGNGGYDVRHYDLDVEYDPATDEIEGEAEIEAKATQNLCSFNLDLVGLEVDKVEVDRKRARFSRSGQELTITPKRALKKWRSFEAEIRYDGVPTEFSIPGTTIRTGFMATPEGATVAGQPEVAAGWFPVNDHPLDKASYSFDVSVPSGYEVAANGFLRDVDRRGRSIEWEWEAREPMASYLSTIDISDDWEVTRTRTEQGIPQYDAVDARLTGGLRAEIDDSLSRQGEILALLIDHFGPYPFSTVGAIVPNQNDLGFALETQTRAVYSKLFWLTGQGVPRDADWVVVHELAHQWFGDDVALARWQDIWLNEGFASYAEWMWEEYEGRATPQEIFVATYNSIPADNAFWDTVIGDPGVELLFDGAVYTRGAMTLQALRNEVGDDDFWEIVREWASSQSGGHGTTPEFIALAEEISGQELDELFDIWLFTGEKPPPSAVTGPAARAKAADRNGAGNWNRKVERRLEIGQY
jgi:aminopeptidase N